MRLVKKSKKFTWSPFSKKQLLASIWWLLDDYKDKDGIIADGSRRSGKTLALIVSFVRWAFANYNHENFIVAGKTIGAFMRNVYYQMRNALEAQGYIVDYKRTESMFIIQDRNGKQNYFYVFGGKDVSSADQVQGMTAAGAFLDEAVIMPEEFIAMVLSSCSVDGAKFWFTCNPDNPNHYFKKEFIDKASEKKLIYLHFSMDDNLSLTERTKELYKRQFTGVFYKRYILGLWVIAEGLIYEKFTNNKDMYLVDEVLDRDVMFISIGVDFGGNKSATTFVATGFSHGIKKMYVLKSERREGIKDSPESLEKSFIDFYDSIDRKYPFKIKRLRVDSAEQILRRGLQNRLIKNDIRLSVDNSLKKEISERIQFEIEMFSDMKVYFVRGETDSLQYALETAMWADNPVKDERLDNGSSDIDSLDAFEYSWEEWMEEMQSSILRA